MNEHRIQICKGHFYTIDSRLWHSPLLVFGFWKKRKRHTTSTKRKSPVLFRLLWRCKFPFYGSATIFRHTSGGCYLLPHFGKLPSFSFAKVRIFQFVKLLSRTLLIFSTAIKNPRVGFELESSIGKRYILKFNQCQKISRDVDEKAKLLIWYCCFPLSVWKDSNSCDKPTRRNKANKWQ